VLILSGFVALIAVIAHSLDKDGNRVPAAFGAVHQVPAPKKKRVRRPKEVYGADCHYFVAGKKLGRTVHMQFASAYVYKTGAKLSAVPKATRSTT
jgi:hypothetical protein